MYIHYQRYRVGGNSNATSEIPQANYSWGSGAATRKPIPIKTSSAHKPVCVPSYIMGIRPDETGGKPGIFPRGPRSPEGGPNVYAKKRIRFNHLITGHKKGIIKSMYDVSVELPILP